MTTLPVYSPLTQFLMCRRKPQAKSLSPTARRLFGKSDTPAVKDMLQDVLNMERRKGICQLNFDIYNEKPAPVEQRENISAVDNVQAQRRRYVWKSAKPGEVPGFYFRACPGKRNALVDRMADARPKYATEDRNSAMSPPLRFDDTKDRQIPLHKPLAVHATSENAFTVRSPTPSENALSQRSPLAQRNQIGIRRSLNFSSVSAKTSTARNHTAEGSQGSVTPSLANEKSISTPKPTSSAHSALKQLKITDMTTIRKPRPSVMKARKRLRLADEIDCTQPKMNKMANEEAI